MATTACDGEETVNECQQHAFGGIGSDGRETVGRWPLVSAIVLINADRLQDFITEIFAATACSEAEAARIAANLVEASLSGHDSHGVIRTERYVGWIEAGVQLPDQELTVVLESPSLAVVDGNYGMGQTVGPLATEKGIEMAKRDGVAVVALRNAGHLGRIGAYAEMAADAGLASHASCQRGRRFAGGAVRRRGSGAWVPTRSVSARRSKAPTT